MIATSVKLERTWLDRFLRQSTPTLSLDRDAAYMVASAALPQAYQSGLSAEYFVHLDSIVGRYPLGPLFPRYARALAAGIDDEDDHPGLDWTPPPPELSQVLTVVNRSRHTTWQLMVPNGVDTPLLPVDKWRTYLLVVNNSAVDALIAYDKAATGGLRLAAGGGSHELTNGTTSALRGQGVGGDATLTVIEGRAWPAKACLIPCEGYE